MTIRGSLRIVSRQSIISPIRSFWRCRIGGVADAHEAVAAEALEVVEMLLVELALAADAVDRLQRPRLGDVAQETR